MVIVGTFEVSLFKNDANKGWASLVDEGATCKAQLIRDDEDCLVMIFKQTSPQAKELYRARATNEMTVKKLRDDFIQVQITSGVLFGIKFSDKTFVNPEKFLAHFKGPNSAARVIEQDVRPSLPQPAMQPQQKPAEFSTVAGGFRPRDVPDYQEQQRYNTNPNQMSDRFPNVRPQHNFGSGAQNWSGNLPNQGQQMPLGGHMRVGNQYSNPVPQGGAHHWSDQQQNIRSPLNQPQQNMFPMGGAQPWPSPPVNQPQGDMLPMGSSGHSRPVEGVAQHWSGQHLSATPPRNVMEAWGANKRQRSNEDMQPQSPVAKPEAPKRVAPKSEKELESYVHCLESALMDGEGAVDFAKAVVKLLVETRQQQQNNFSVKFSSPKLNKRKDYFRLKVTIEREIAPNEKGIMFFLQVNEDFTIRDLQNMFEIRFSIGQHLQHWIIGSKFATDTEAKLKDFGLRGKGAEVHLFISKGEVGDVPSDSDHVTHNGYHQQHWSQNQQIDPYYQQHNAPSAGRQWRGGPYVPEGPVNSHGNGYPMEGSHPQYNSYPDAGGQQFGANRVTPESVAMPPRLPTPPPPRPVTPPPPPGWKCTFCTAHNEPYRPGCQLCDSPRPEDYKPPADYQPTKGEEKWISDAQRGQQEVEELHKSQRELQQRQARENYEAMLAVANKSLVPNDEKFDCPVCYTEIEVGDGVKLRECLHNCCKDCLHDHIMASNDADVLCPCNDEFACGGSITEAEMREILDDEELGKVHSRGLNLAEGQSRSYHCKTPDCKGWCIYEDDVNVFNCMVCRKPNCLLCKAIHAPQSCKEYQDDLRIKAANDKAAQETQKMIQDMVKNGEAMFCPNENCGLIIQKKNGCDWIRCSCRTEICWVTKGPRWGPKGHGDKSGGCKCKVDGKKCHPQCGNCH